MSTRRRDLDFIRAAEARRTLDRRACAAGLSGAGLRVWMIVSDYTLGYCRVEDFLTHGRIAEETGLARRSVSRALAEVAAAGLIRYQAGIGDPQQGRNAFSRIAVVMPTSEAQGGDDEMVFSRDDEMVPSPRGEGTEPSWGRGRNGHKGDDEMVASREDEMVPSEMTGPSSNRERATKEDGNRERATREDTRGVAGSATEVQTAREEAPPTPEPDLPSTPSTALVRISSVEAKNEEQPEPEWDGDFDTLNAWLEKVCPAEPDPQPAVRRVGAATGEQAVQRFVAESGLPLSKQTRETLARSLDEVTGTVSPNELLCALGYWHEKRSGKYPQDAAERVTEAMAYEHGCLIDPVNAMSPSDAIQEGRCRAQMGMLSPAEREAAQADLPLRMKGFGLDWPAPASPAGLLPDPRPDASAFDPFSIPLAEWRRALAPAGRL